MNAALGHVLPVHMPPQWNEQLEELENQLSEPESWPTDASQAKQFVRAVSALVSELTPLAESTYFTRLAPLRWVAVAFDALYREGDLGETAFNRADQLRAIADAKLEGVDSELDRKLRHRAEELINEAEESAINALVDQAKHFLNNPETELHDQFVASASFQEVYDHLGFYIDHVSRHEEIEGIREELERRISIREAREQANALTERWNKAKELAVENGPVYETAASILLREVTVARALTALRGIETSDYDVLVVDVRKAVDNIQDRVNRRYQAWALKRIMAFEERQEEIKSSSGNTPEVERDHGGKDGENGLLDKSLEELDAVGDFTDKIFGGKCANERCREVQNAIVAHLLPIDQVLLDLPVLKRYHREFDEGWKYLDGQDEQTCVAIAAAVVRKRTLRDFQDHRPEAGIVEGSELWRDRGCEQ